MKHKEKNNSSSSIDENYTKALRWFSEIPLKRLDTGKIWNQVSEKLENLDKKVLSWFMLSAATCTLVVAAGLQYVDLHKVEQNSDQTFLSHSNKMRKEPSEQFQVKDLKNEVLTLAYRKPVPIMLNSAKTLTCHDSLEKKQRTLLAVKKKRKTSEIIPKITFKVGTAYQMQTLLPEFSADLLTFQKDGMNRQHTIQLGYSMQWVAQRNFSENEMRKINLLHYVNLSYTNKSFQSKGWEASIGYLLNSDNSVYRKQTIRASWHKRIGKHIGFGPELIFTNNFKKVYPGISLWVSS